MKLTLLDMGDEKYGDCVVVEHKDIRILVDGGHIRDFEQRGETPSIPEQLAEVLGAQPPFNFDLLVVTHCHGDHIGCLPTLVSDGTVTADTALVAHEDLGFPAAEGGTDAELDDVAARVVAALREEPRMDFKSDAELDRFLSDAVKLEPSYRAMLKQLERQGTTLHPLRRHRRRGHRRRPQAAHPQVRNGRPYHPRADAGPPSALHRRHRQVHQGGADGGAAPPQRRRDRRRGYALQGTLRHGARRARGCR